MIISKCSQEEERLRSQAADYANLIKQEGTNKRVTHSKNTKKNQNPYQKLNQDPKEDSSFHLKVLIRKECPEFKAWPAKKGNDDIISLIDESFYAYFH